MAENTNAASQSLKKPTPISSGATGSRVWTPEEKKEAKELYWINIHETDCDFAKSQDTSLPTNSFVVSYTSDNSDVIHYDIVMAQKQSDIFNFYWDKLKKGLKAIAFTKGNRKPSLWGVQPKPPSKRKKKE